MKIKGKPSVIKDQDVIKFAIDSLEYSVDRMIKTGDFKPMINLFDGEKMNVIVTAWANNSEKEAFFNLIHHECERLSAHFVIVTLDAWLSRRTVDHLSENEINKIINSPPDVMPRDDPKRTEAILVLIYLPNGQLDTISAPYTRSEDNNPVFSSAFWMDNERIAFRLLKPWVKNYS